MLYNMSSAMLYILLRKCYILAIHALLVYKGRMPKVMVNIRVEAAVVEMFDKAAAKHRRTRTKELIELMIEDIRREFPAYEPPEGA